MKTGGRKKGTPNKARSLTTTVVAKSGITPMDFLLSVVRDDSHALPVRIDAAKAVAPYVHPRLNNIEHSGPKGGALVLKLVDADGRL